jgi:hypothetical protein
MEAVMADRRVFDEQAAKRVSVGATFEENIEQIRKIGERIDRRLADIDEVGRKTDEWLDKWLNRQARQGR